MNKNSNPLDYVLSCCEQGLVPSSFDINNAKDELKKIRKTLDQYNNVQPVGWIRINDKGDLYDPRLCYNPHLDPNTVIPLYLDKKSYERWNNERKSK